MKIKKIIKPKRNKETHKPLKIKIGSKEVICLKKMSWKIVKIITKEGEYIPSADNEVFLVMTKKAKRQVKSKEKSQ